MPASAHPFEQLESYLRQLTHSNLNGLQDFASIINKTLFEANEHPSQYVMHSGDEKYLLHRCLEQLLETTTADYDGKPKTLAIPMVLFGLGKLAANRALIGYITPVQTRSAIRALSERLIEDPLANSIGITSTLMGVTNLLKFNLIKSDEFVNPNILLIALEKVSDEFMQKSELNEADEKLLGNFFRTLAILLKHNPINQMHQHKVVASVNRLLSRLDDTCNVTSQVMILSGLARIAFYTYSRPSTSLLDKNAIQRMFEGLLELSKVKQLKSAERAMLCNAITFFIPHWVNATLSADLLELRQSLVAMPSTQRGVKYDQQIDTFLDKIIKRYPMMDAMKHRVLESGLYIPLCLTVPETQKRLAIFLVNSDQDLHTTSFKEALTKHSGCEYFKVTVPNPGYQDTRAIFMALDKKIAQLTQPAVKNKITCAPHAHLHRHPWQASQQSLDNQTLARTQENRITHQT